MDFSLTTPALLYSAISLLLLAYTNRFLALAALIRDLHKQFLLSKDSLIPPQIQSIKKRITLIKYMQLLGGVSFFLCTVSMFMLFTEHVMISKALFVSALVALMVSLALSIWEVYISVDALNLRLSNMQQQ